MLGFQQVLVCLSVFALCTCSKPNIVFILTDDQDVKLGSLEVQPLLKEYLIEQGTFFKNAFVTTPVCCPSRSSTLTGKYVHNHHTYENGVPKGCNAPSWRQLNEKKTIGAYMSTAGYKTGFFGKYLNHYGQNDSGVGLDHIPPGWTTWYALQGNSKFYHYTVSNQGVAEKHADDYEKDYFTDRIRDHAVQFIKDSAAKAKSGDTPFFMYVATPAPHRPATPAPQYSHKYDGKKAPRTPSYGDPGKDKHWIISEGTPPINSSIAAAIDELYELRLESLLSVDDLVTAVMKELESAGVIDNTFIFYNSDHGYHLGQFKQQGEKRQIYEENIRVPLIVRGPGVKSNVNVTSVALNIDLAPTFIDLAGAPIPDDMDGESLKSVLLGDDEAAMERSQASNGTQFLVEYFGEGNPCMGSKSFLHDCSNNTFMAVRYFGPDGEEMVWSQYYKSDQAPPSESELYMTEYYDITKDNWQLTNTYSSVSPAMKKTFTATVSDLMKCSGSSCSQHRHKKLF